MLTSENNKSVDLTNVAEYEVGNKYDLLISQQFKKYRKDRFGYRVSVPFAGLS